MTVWKFILEFFEMLFDLPRSGAEPPQILDSDTPTLPAAPPRFEWPDAVMREPVPEPEEVSMLPPTYADKKRVIQAILSTFETGKPEGDYSAIIVLPDRAGITYGLHQATRDSLHEIIRRYVAHPDADREWADGLAQYLPRLERDGTRDVDPNALPDWVNSVMDLLVGASDDWTMRQAQDEVFEERYWKPALMHCDDMKLELPLSWAMIYDTCIQSGPAKGVDRIRAKFPGGPPSRGGDEKEWTIAYLNARYLWLSTHERPVVRSSAVRVQQLLGLAEEENWNLDTPFSFGPPYRVTIE